ncbi:MAG: twin transmembrane helix small protein [Hyphomicrobiaceae bacterium]
MVHLTVLSALCVFGVLLAGLWNMVRAGSSPNLSQKLMRWRIGLQFLAIIITMLTIAIMNT